MLVLFGVPTVSYFFSCVYFRIILPCAEEWNQVYAIEGVLRALVWSCLICSDHCTTKVHRCVAFYCTLNIHWNSGTKTHEKRIRLMLSTVFFYQYKKGPIPCVWDEFSLLRWGGPRPPWSRPIFLPDARIWLRHFETARNIFSLQKFNFFLFWRNDIEFSHYRRLTQKGKNRWSVYGTY